MFQPTRAAIATALSTVAGITGYQYRPSVLSSGTAWPLLSSVERGPGVSWGNEWRIIVVLSGDEIAAYGMLDSKLEDIAEALDPIVFVHSAQPVTVDTSAGVLYAVELKVSGD
jgi:hypothetical protein